MKILFNKKINFLLIALIFFIGIFSVFDITSVVAQEEGTITDTQRLQRAVDEIKEEEKLKQLEKQSEESVKKVIEVSSEKESGTVLNQKDSSGKQTGDFVALEGDFFEQKLGGQDAVKNPSIFFNNLFQFGVYIAGFLATIMIAIGGITYMTTGAVDGKKLGKEMITSALTGLLIILFSWILLNQINPDLLNLKI